MVHKQEMKAGGERALTEISPGQTVRLVRVEAGHGLRTRLAAMGLFPNVSLTVLRNSLGGQIIVLVKGSKIVLGRGMSHKVFVV